jgi:site-specific recombinase XerD
LALRVDPGSQVGNPAARGSQPEEVLRLLQAAPSFPHHVIFSTMYGTGARVSETVHLRATDIDSQRLMIRIE